MRLPPAAGRVTVTAVTPDTTVTPEPWPLRRLELRTPRLSLRPDDDDGLRELAALAASGIHPPEQMPFLHPWTDQPVDELVRATLQHHWSVRAALGPDGWTINFLVRHEGDVVGTQGLSGKDYAATREVSTGSWLGRTHQGRGIGTEMRAAVLLLAFDHLGAGTARSGAFTDNAPRSPSAGSWVTAPTARTRSRRAGSVPSRPDCCSPRRCL